MAIVTRRTDNTLCGIDFEVFLKFIIFIYIHENKKETRN